MKYEFELLPVSTMLVDASYQRPAEEKDVNYIAKNWDYRKANPIHVSHRADGKYYVMDGNHTRLAYQKIGGRRLPCRIYEGLTRADEARIFAELNSAHKKPKFPEMLKAKAAGGYEIESSYLQALDEARVPYTFTNTHGCKVKCHNALLTVYRGTSRELMLRALKVAKEAADGREEFYQVGFFPGLCSVITNHPEINDERPITVAKRTTSSKVREIADSMKRVGVGGSHSATRSYRKAFIELYNKGLKKNRIEE